MKNFHRKLTEAEIRRLIQKKLKEQRFERRYRHQPNQRMVKLSAEAASETQTFVGLEALEGEWGAKPETISGRAELGKALVGIEFLVVAAILITAVIGFKQLLTLNHHASAAWNIATPTPTPLIQAVVLPSGHHPPTAPGGARPRMDEIPEHLQPLVQAAAALPTPVPAPQHAIRIQIPAIQVDAPVVQGDGWEQLKKGVAQHLGTANPGEQGNMVLSGHNDVYGEVFRYLDRLQPGDEIILFTAQERIVYIVEEWFLVHPGQVEVMSRTIEPIVTLISCYPYLIDTQRIIVRGRLLRG